MRACDLLINSDPIDNIPQKASLTIIVFVLASSDEDLFGVFAAMYLVFADLAVFDILEGIGD